MIRTLVAILGVLAMLVTASGSIAALTVKAPCDDASMAEMAMADDMAHCKPASKACAEPCLAVGNCQSQCGSTTPFVVIDPDDLVSRYFKVKLDIAGNEHPPGTHSPVDGPPPRI